MIMMPTRSAQPGMRLGRSVFDSDGRLVLAAGVTLRPRYIGLLLAQEFKVIYVAGEPSEIELPEIVRQETRQEVISHVTRLMTHGVLADSQAVVTRAGDGCTVKQGGQHMRRHDLAMKVVHAADILVNEILTRQEVTVGLVDIKSMQDYTFAHSVQVALSAIIVGKILGYNRKALCELGVGALLHDTGKTSVPDQIWFKDTSLTDEEYKHVTQHPAAGYEFLRGSGVHLLSAHVAFQHHERCDGSGYPRGLKGNDILNYGRVCAVCDVFDAMTSERPYRQAVHPCEALSFITDNAGTLFDPEVVRAFVTVVAPYPVATSVILSTGEVAVVKKLNARQLDRPVVTVIKDPNHEFYGQFRDIDLADNPGLSITGYVSWYDIPANPGA